MLAIVMALGAAAAWGAADFLGGLKTRQLSLAVVAIVSQTAGLVICVAIVAAQDLPDGALLGYGALAGIVNAIGLAAFYRALALGRMSVAAPIVGMSALVPVVAGLAEGERPGTAQVAGIVLGIAGVVVASRALDEGEQPGGPANRVIPLAIVAALAIGGNLLWVEKAVAADPEASVLWILAASRGVTVVLIAAVVLAAVRVTRPQAAALPPLIALGALDVAANALYALAVEETLLSVASVLASLHPVATILLARAFLGERLQRVQLGGVVLVMAGIVLLAGGQGA